MKRILGLTVTVLIVMGLVGGGTWAYFSDPETSTGNIVTAGTLDLRTDDVNGVAATLFTENLKPGAYVPTAANATITLKNEGTIDGGSLDITVAYVETDNATQEAIIAGDTDLSGNLTADQYATGLTLTIFDYDGTNLITSANISDENGNSRVDIHDLKAASDANKLVGLAGLTASASKDLNIRVQLDSSANNTFMADGITTTFTFTLQQQ